MVRVDNIVFLLAITISSTRASALHGQCLTNEDCGTIDTYCKEGVCVCRKNFAVWFDSCIQMPSEHIPCKKKNDCHRALGSKSLCNKHLKCACKPFHHIHNGTCVKNRELHDVCEHDHQCYCGEDCSDKIACIGRNCTCKPGNRAYRSRRCISDYPVLLTQTSSAETFHPFELFIALGIFILNLSQ